MDERLQRLTSRYDASLSEELTFKLKKAFRRDLFDLDFTCNFDKAIEPLRISALAYGAAVRLETSLDLLKFELGPQLRFYNPHTEQAEDFRPDLLLTWKNYEATLLLCIPLMDLPNEIQFAKIEATEMYAADHFHKVQIWTELDVFGDNPSYTESLLLFYKATQPNRSCDIFSE